MTLEQAGKIKGEINVLQGGIIQYFAQIDVGHKQHVQPPGFNESN